MPKKPKSVEEHFEIIENLLIGIILKRKPNIKDVAKIVGFSDKRITEMYPQPKESREGDGTEGVKKKWRKKNLRNYNQ